MEPTPTPQQQIPYFRLARVISGYIFAPLLIFGGLGYWLTQKFDNKVFVFACLAAAFFVTMGLMLTNVNKIVKKIMNQ